MATAINYASSSDVGEYIENLQSSTALAVSALGSILTRASRMIDQYTGTRFYTSTGAETKIFDGPRWNRDPYVPAPGLSYWFGSQRFMPNVHIASSSGMALLLATGTNDASNNIYVTIDTRDFSPEPRDKRDNYPFSWLEMSDSPVGTYSTASFQWFSPGKGTIKLTAYFGGWDTTAPTGVPDDIRESCVEIAVRMYRARSAGFSDLVGVDQMGTAVFTKALPQSVRMTLDAYRRIQIA